VPQGVVGALSGLATGVTSTGFLVAGAFLFVGCFIDAIPAIMIVGTMLMPLAKNAGMHPIHFAIIGVISLAFGLVTPPYGLCLMIASTIGQIKLVQALRDVALILIPMLLLLTLVILFPEIVLWLPRLIAPKFM
jgi:TRAP-type C4-dicarboxylate transport system permease large subunit